MKLATSSLLSSLWASRGPAIASSPLRAHVTVRSGSRMLCTRASPRWVMGTMKGSAAVSTYCVIPVEGSVTYHGVAHGSDWPAMASPLALRCEVSESILLLRRLPRSFGIVDASYGSAGPVPRLDS